MINNLCASSLSRTVRSSKLLAWEKFAETKPVFICIHACKEMKTLLSRMLNRHTARLPTLLSSSIPSSPGLVMGRRSSQQFGFQRRQASSTLNSDVLELFGAFYLGEVPPEAVQSAEVPQELRKFERELVAVSRSLSSEAGGRASSQSDRKSTRLNSSHSGESRMPSSA